MNEGLAYIDVNQNLGAESIEYHSSFYLLSGTGVNLTKQVSPNRFELFQNHPNPFNPTTEICFNLPNPVQVYLNIYDINGRLVRKFSASFSAGKHSIWWDGRDDLRNPLSSGIYCYRLQAGRFSDVKRMVLLR